MFDKMKYQYVLVFGLVILLSVLAFFQYRWVEQISQAEKERLQKRLEIDSRYFSDDFNRMIQETYFIFQLSGNNWEPNFLERYEIWQQKAPYRQLIQGFTLIQRNGQILKFNEETKEFIDASDFTRFDFLENNLPLADGKNLLLTMPIYEQPNRFPDFGGSLPNPLITQQILGMPRIVAFLQIKLNEEIIKNKVIPDLTKKYFPDGDFAVSITTKENDEPLFQTAKLENSDYSLPIFELMPEGINFFIDRNLEQTLRNSAPSGQITLNREIEKQSDAANLEGKLKIQIFKNNQILNRGLLKSDGLWVLHLRHKDGSLEKFVNNSRRRNLFISFGILGLLATSIGIIFFTAQRAQNLAQRQIDFVSAVSHEFRTPISVIYSAAENLADGVARESQQVSRYGNLIKEQGRKLSGMVEQILEFAGARSHHKKYDFQRVTVREVVENAVLDCSPILTNNNFNLEVDYEDHYDFIDADKESLSQAIQNLIINGIKYSTNSTWLGLKTKSNKFNIQIIVEDRGAGIAKKDLKKIFLPFYRAKSMVDAQIPGNGLGLSLVKQTVEAHRGRVYVQSIMGEGSRFIIELPKAIDNQTVKS